MDLARKLQFDGGPGLPSPHTSQMSGDEALAKLFPPAPTLGAGAGAPAVPNRGFGWGAMGPQGHRGMGFVLVCECVSCSQGGRWAKEGKQAKPLPFASMSLARPRDAIPDSARWSVSLVEASKAQAKRREEEERFKRWNAGNLNSTNFFRPHFLGKACPLALVLLSLRGKWAKVWQTQKGTKPNAVPLLWPHRAAMRKRR
eukprot:g16419.t1